MLPPPLRRSRLGDFVGWLVHASDAGIVDQHVQRAEMRGHRVERLRDRLLVRHVDMPVARRGATPGWQRADHGLARRVEHVEGGDEGAFVGQALRACMADALRSPGDDADLVGDPAHGDAPCCRR